MFTMFRLWHTAYAVVAEKCEGNNVQCNSGHAAKQVPLCSTGFKRAWQDHTLLPSCLKL